MVNAYYVKSARNSDVFKHYSGKITKSTEERGEVLVAAHFGGKSTKL